MTPRITSIVADNLGYGYQYHVTADAPYDVWLDGTLLGEGVTDATWTLESGADTPPPIEVVGHGERPTCAWALRRGNIQWFAGEHQAFRLTEWRGGQVYAVRHVEVPGPHRYHVEPVVMAADDPIEQTWEVAPAVAQPNGQYVVDGPPVMTLVRRHYGPRPPLARAQYQAGKVVIR